MNLKIVSGLSIILIVVVIIAVAGRNRSSASNFTVEPASSENFDAVKTENKDSFVPLAADNNADANARDVLIAAGKAKSAPALLDRAMAQFRADDT
jgi:hypothetical protein